MPSESGSSRADSASALERRKIAKTRKSCTADVPRSVLRVRLFMGSRKDYRITPGGVSSWRALDPIRRSSESNHLSRSTSWSSRQMFSS